MATKTTDGANYRARYRETLHHVPKDMSKLLSSYSGIPKEEQIAHITKLRNEAYAEVPYPCMGTFRFLDLDLARHQAYKEHVLAPLCEPATPGKPEPLYLDCGCCLGQDVRKLLVDGAPSHRLWASDIEPRFIELGFELFRDGDKLPRDHFLCPGNLLTETKDPAEDKLNLLNDRVTILGISAVFHLFDLEDDKRIVNRCLRLLKKDTGAPVLVIGAQRGAFEAERFRRRSDAENYVYTHSNESWGELWREVCAQPQWKGKITALEVKTKLFDGTRNDDPDADEVYTLREIQSKPTGDVRMWQMFEVWVTFKSDS
jgi:hypothetical protein